MAVRAPSPGVPSSWGPPPIAPAWYHPPPGRPHCRCPAMGSPPWFALELRSPPGVGTHFSQCPFSFRARLGSLRSPESLVQPGKGQVTHTSLENDINTYWHPEVCLPPVSRQVRTQEQMRPHRSVWDPAWGRGWVPPERPAPYTPLLQTRLGLEVFSSAFVRFSFCLFCLLR